METWNVFFAALFATLPPTLLGIAAIVTAWRQHTKVVQNTTKVAEELASVKATGETTEKLVTASKEVRDDTNAKVGEVREIVNGQREAMRSEIDMLKAQIVQLNQVIDRHTQATRRRRKK